MFFEKATPEEMGIKSKKVLEFIKMLDNYQMHTHSIIMARGNKIFAECYYEPFHKDFLHRMYSVSKSFVSIAVGLAMTEGLLKLEDPIIKYFPEFRNENIDDCYEECTIRNMLSMQSNINVTPNWWGKYKSRVEAYYANKTGQIPGGLYYYDSIGSFLLGCIVEKLTGKTFLEYLKEKVLLEIGFSKESYTLYEPGGFTVGDSGVMCTSRDLLLFARFIMNKGEWNGKQYIDREFMEQAISKQSDNDISGAMCSWKTGGYGYLIWKTHPDGFSLVGMGEQLAICDMKKDLIFVITSDDQSDLSVRSVIYHEFYNHFLKDVKDVAIEKDDACQKELEECLSCCTLNCQQGKEYSSLAEKVSGVKYIMEPNTLNISHIKLNLSKSSGTLEFEKDGQGYELEFGLCNNKLTEFSFGERNSRFTMGKTEVGKYHCASSGAWQEENVFSIKTHVIDAFLGCLNVHMAFKDKRVTVFMHKSGQYVFDGIGGYAIGKAET